MLYQLSYTDGSGQFSVMPRNATKGFLVPMAVGALPEDKKPAACLGCRSCEAVCPQGIKISEMMQHFAERLKK